MRFLSEIRKSTRSTLQVKLWQEYTLQLPRGSHCFSAKLFLSLAWLFWKRRQIRKQALGHFPNTRLHFLENAQRKSSALFEILPLCCNYSAQICEENLRRKCQCFSLKKKFHPPLYVIWGINSCRKPPTSFLRNMASCWSWREPVYLK